MVSSGRLQHALGVPPHLCRPFEHCEYSVNLLLQLSHSDVSRAVRHLLCSQDGGSRRKVCDMWRGRCAGTLNLTTKHGPRITRRVCSELIGRTISVMSSSRLAPNLRRLFSSNHCQGRAGVSLSGWPQFVCNSPKQHLHGAVTPPTMHTCGGTEAKLCEDA